MVLGGIHVTTSPESFKNSIFDLAVIGEGEIPFSKIIKFLSENKIKNDSLINLKNIKGLLIRDKDNIVKTGICEHIENLDTIPIPSRELLNMKYYLLPSFSSGNDIEPNGTMITSRGCPFNCTFCSSNVFWGRRVRFFSAERVVQEIELLYKKYNYKKITIFDDTFTLNLPRLRNILKIMKEKRLNGKIKFSVLGRANTFTDEVAKILQALNVKSINFGMETGSQKVLNYLKKENVTVQDNINAHYLAIKHGITSSAFLMIGSPYETLDDINETKKLIKNHLKDDFIIYQTIPFPGTEIWDYAIQNKIIDNEFYERKQKEFIDVDTSILLSKEISKEEFIKEFNEINSLHLKRNRNIFITLLKNLKLGSLKGFFSIYVVGNITTHF